MQPGLETIVIGKPKAFDGLTKESAEAWFEADQRVLTALKKGLIDVGEKQLKAKTGYTNNNLPNESPKRTDPFTLDDIEFSLITNAKVNNPPYQEAVDRITTFLEIVIEDWKEGAVKRGVRQYDVTIENQDGSRTTLKQPFINWNYLMRAVFRYLSKIMVRGVENQFDQISAPKEYDTMELNRLAIPIALMRNFDIDRPGAAKLWYLARRFYNDVATQTVEPLEEELEERSGVTAAEMPEETEDYWEQVAGYLFRVKSIPSPRRQPGKLVDRLFLVPERDKPDGSTALPEIITPENFINMLETYRDILSTSLKTWKQLEGRIGELMVFYYGIENQERVQKEFPYISAYDVRRDGSEMYVAVPALLRRINDLQQDYKKNRLLRVHSAVPLI